MDTAIVVAILGLLANVVATVITTTSTKETAQIEAEGAIRAAYTKAKKELLSEEELNEQLRKVSPAQHPLVRVQWPMVVGLGLVVGLLLGAVAWLWPFLTHKPPTSPDALVDSFEEKNIADEWAILNGEAELSRSGDCAFAGRYSLRVNTKLTQRRVITEPAGTLQLDLRGRNIQDKIVTFRVYVPDQAPTNLRAALYILDKHSQWRDGPCIDRLPAGKWSTLTWATQDAEDWDPPATVGIEFSLLPATEVTDRPGYDGPIYVDLVEILNLPDIHTDVDQSSLDLILEPLVFYGFEDEVPAFDGITPAGETSRVVVSDEEHLPDGKRSLMVELDTGPYEPDEAGWGGVYVDLGGTERVEAMRFSILIPDRDEINSGGFSAYFLAVDGNDNVVYSGSRTVPVGRWSSQFWGTRYAYAGPVLCPDEDRNDQCDEPAKIWWHGWKETDVKGFYIRILRSDEGYQGPVYIDNLGVYQPRS